MATPSLSDMRGYEPAALDDLVRRSVNGEFSPAGMKQIAKAFDAKGRDFMAEVEKLRKEIGVDEEGRGGAPAAPTEPTDGGGRDLRGRSGESAEGAAEKRDKARDEAQRAAFETVRDKVATLLAEGMPVDREKLAKIAKDAKLQAAKKIDEAAEAGLVLAAREIVGKGDPLWKTYDTLVQLYKDQPNLSAKTSTSKIAQAYSTPAPLAFVASQLAQIAETRDVDGKPILESTAGNGMLLIEADPKSVQANEMDPVRAQTLRDQGFEVSQEDATKWEPKEESGHVIINPPFGTIRTEEKTNQEFPFVGDETTTQIDHSIAIRALENMTEDGRAVLILGGIKATDPDARRKAYNTGDKARFYKHLYQNYKVIDHFTVDGDLYKKQGAGWPIDVIVIDGKGQAPTDLPSQIPPRIISTWVDLGTELEKTDGQRIDERTATEGEIRDALVGSLGKGAGDAKPPVKPDGGRGDISEPEKPPAPQEPDGGDGRPGKGATGRKAGPPADTEGVSDVASGGKANA